jgi:Fe-S oxidoreductase
MLFSKIAQHTFDPLEYISMLMNDKKLGLHKSSLATNFNNIKVFYHDHCQMKSISKGFVASELFHNLGFDVTTSNVECCGMAGSFGYKKEYYELSKNVGDDLVRQIKDAAKLNKEMIILASGTSCREQIKDGLNTKVYHPIEFLEKILL